MADKSEITVERVFELMDQWRHLPAYQLERRADIFFALFLPEVLSKELGICIDPILIPEFPIKKESSNKSNNVDYLALQIGSSESRPRRAFLIELKTDMASRRSEQDVVLDRAVNRGLKSLIKDVRTIAEASQAKTKYVHLLFYLKKLELVSYGEEKDEDLYDRALRGDYEIFKKVRPASWVCNDEPKLEAIYVQPNQPSTVVDFRTFACIVEEGQENNDIRRLFAQYLRRWACTRAGDSSPRDSLR